MPPSDFVNPPIYPREPNSTIGTVLVCGNDGLPYKPGMNRSDSFSLLPSLTYLQGLDLEDWTDLPLSKHLGIPLMFKSCSGVPDHLGANEFANIMGIDPDFAAHDDIDITNNGFKTTMTRETHAYKIEVMRVDGKDLQKEDLEALVDYVSQRFPYMQLLSSRYSTDNRHDFFVQATRMQWKDAGDEWSFVAWWHGWKARKAADAQSSKVYKSLQCPVGAPTSIADQADRKSRCAIQ